MGGVQVGVDEADCDTLKTRFCDFINNGLHLCSIDINQDVAIGIHTSRHREAHLTRQQRLWQVQVEVILLKPRLGPHLDNIAKPFRGDQGRLRTTPLNQRVGRQGGAVDDLVNFAWSDTRLGADLMHPINDRILRGDIGSQHFSRERHTVFLQHYVSKGAADIDAKTDGCRCHLRLLQ